MTDRTRRRLRWLVPGLIVLAVGSAVVVGRAATGSPPDFTINGDTTTLLQPGGPAQPIDLAFSNPNSVSLSVSGLIVSVASVSAPNATPALPCTVADYAVTQYSGAYPFKIAAGASTLQSAGTAQAAWPSLAMVETHSDQDGCKGATVKLSYAGDAFNDDPDTTPPSPGPAPTTPTVTTPATTTTAPSTPLTPPAAGRPGIALTIAPPSQSIRPGQEAVFTFAVRNAGTTQLTGVTVEDTVSPACARTIGPLAAGAVQRYACVEANIKKSFVETAFAKGFAPGGAKVTATASARVELAALRPPVHPAIAIRILPASQWVTTRIVTRRATTSVGYGGAAFRIRVTNRGNVALSAVRVADRLVPDCSRTLGRLAPGAVRTYRCVSVAVRRSFTNTAFASGRAPGGKKVTARSRSHVHVRVVGKTTTVKPKVEAVLTIPDVLFAFNKSDLRPGSAHVLAAIVDTLNKRYPGHHLTITGYTDSVGSVAYNLDLSRRRATAVAGWLAQHGVPRGLISIAWKGEADPVASNATAEGRQKNRRVTITVRTVRP